VFASRAYVSFPSSVTLVLYASLLTLTATTDSWKHHTAFIEAVFHPEDPARTLVLQILLQFVPEPRFLAARITAKELGQSWASDIINEWTVGGKEKGEELSSLLLPDHPS
jgi:hypothetical protein